MFCEGETVVYKHHVCEFVSLRKDYYEGRDYYELRALFEKTSKYFVPVESGSLPTIRRTMTKSEALALIDSVKDMGVLDEERLARNVASASLLDRKTEGEYAYRLHAYTPEQLLWVVKNAYECAEARTAKGKNATSVDKRFLQLAQDLLCDEISVSLGIDREEVPVFLEQRIKRAMGRA